MLIKIEDCYINPADIAAIIPEQENVIIYFRSQGGIALLPVTMDKMEAAMKKAGFISVDNTICTLSEYNRRLKEKYCDW